MIFCVECKTKLNSWWGGYLYYCKKCKINYSVDDKNIFYQKHTLESCNCTMSGFCNEENTPIITIKKEQK